MKNEIGRKITSLTLMTIMVAGGLTFAIPGVTPAAHAIQPNLFVSAENSQFDSYMSGPQVIEVVVNDSDINETNESKGEPDVTVNGKDLRMVQATDGNWYGYFASQEHAELADANGADAGLEYGTLCTITQAENGIAITPGTISFSETNGVYVPRNTCESSTTDVMINVLREHKTINDPSTSVATGQIGVNANYWPFIQLYELTVSGNVVVQYNKGGAPQSITLGFDTVEGYASMALDRASYPHSSQVHATITDLWLNIDPTDEDSWTFATGDNSGTFYQVFDENGNRGTTTTAISNLGKLMCDTNCVLLVNPDVQGTTNPVIKFQDNDDSGLETDGSVTGVSGLGTANQPVTITEQGPNSGIFGTYDEGDKSVLFINPGAARGTTASIDYNEIPVSIRVAHDFATLEIQASDGEWNSGEEIPLVLTDGDANRNTRVDEDLILSDPNVDLIPSLRTGSPLTLGIANEGSVFYPTPATLTVSAFSDIAKLEVPSTTSRIVIPIGTGEDLLNAINDNRDNSFTGWNLFNYDVRSLGSGTVTIKLINSSTTITTALPANGANSVTLVTSNDLQDLVLIDSIAVNQYLFDGLTSSSEIALDISTTAQIAAGTYPIAADFFSFGIVGDGQEGGERVANQIIRIEAEETGDNTNTFAGTLEYVMINQLNINNPATYTSLTPIADDPTFIVIEDLTDEDSPRVDYLDLGADGVSTQIADQQAAPSHSGIVSLDSESYKIADTVTVTLEDADLNTNSDLIDVYTVVNTEDDAIRDAVGTGNVSGFSVTLPGNSLNAELGRLLDITFDDSTWTAANTCTGFTSTGLADTGFTLGETSKDSGIFTGDFQIPEQWCNAAGVLESVTGLDIEVNYVDFRDSSGEVIEVGDSAGVRANTGSVSLDRNVYPVPFGTNNPTSGLAVDGDIQNDNKPSTFPLHAATEGQVLPTGDLTIHVRINDPDYDISAAGSDFISANDAYGNGPVKISVLRGSDIVVLGYAGGSSSNDGLIDVDDNNSTTTSPGTVRQFGPISEIAPDAGIFEADIPIRYSDGPSSNDCPEAMEYLPLDGTYRFDDYPDLITAAPVKHCILQGDILQVQYTDPSDASGNENTITDSATFDLRNGVLQSDKPSYIIGTDMILTLIEPDFDLDNDQQETYSLDLIEWDSDDADLTLGSSPNFDPEPFAFRETGDSTGIFQVVIEIPSELQGSALDRGEEIELEYTDWGPSGANYVGEEDEDINLVVYTSNFGATIKLDQKVYTWTDKVFISITAPDHNFDSDLIDEIGETSSDPIRIATRSDDTDNYKLVETGTDTGIFTGELILTGFDHDADGDRTTGDENGYDVTFKPGSEDLSGPTDGTLPTEEEDGLSVSFEFSEDETVIGSALIRWNFGEVEWLEASYPASGSGVVRVIDPDMNFNPEAVDNFEIDIVSTSDAGGIDLTVTETNELTGVFEGTVTFTTTDDSSGHRLRVAENDVVTADYEDNTLPPPNSPSDLLAIKATTIIGSIVPPLERVPVENLRIVDAQLNTLDAVSVGQQVSISGDVRNGQEVEQAYAYLVQVQDSNGVTTSLEWQTGTLAIGQSFTQSSSWTPLEAGTFTVTAFVWESVVSPTAMSPPLKQTVTVS